MGFDVYFSTREIATRLDKSVRTIRRWVAAREFGDQVVMVGGDVMVPWSGVSAFLEKRKLDLSAEGLQKRAAALSRRLHKGELGPARFSNGAGISARSPAELRRKMARTSEPMKEASNG